MDKSIIKEVEIVSVIHETADARTLVLKPLHGWQPRYKAGQFLTLILILREGRKGARIPYHRAPIQENHCPSL